MLFQTLFFVSIVGSIATQSLSPNPSLFNFTQSSIYPAGIVYANTIDVSSPNSRGILLNPTSKPEDYAIYAISNQSSATCNSQWQLDPTDPSSPKRDSGDCVSTHPTDFFIQCHVAQNAVGEDNWIYVSFGLNVNWFGPFGDARAGFVSPPADKILSTSPQPGPLPATPPSPNPQPATPPSPNPQPATTTPPNPQSTPGPAGVDHGPVVSVKSFISPNPQNATVESVPPRYIQTNLTTVLPSFVEIYCPPYAPTNPSPSPTKRLLRFKRNLGL